MRCFIVNMPDAIMQFLPVWLCFLTSAAAPATDLCAIGSDKLSFKRPFCLGVATRSSVGPSVEPQDGA